MEVMRSAMRSDYHVVLCPQRGGDIDVRAFEAGADPAIVVEDVDADLLELPDLLVHVDVHVDVLAEAAKAAAAAHCRHCMAVQLGGMRQVCDCDG
jgi:hypothetical protein